MTNTQQAVDFLAIPTPAGGYIADTINEMLALANAKSKEVRADFNGDPLIARPGMTADEVYLPWRTIRHEREQKREAKRTAVANEIVRRAGCFDDLLAALSNLYDEVYVPDANCSCHIAPPCHDCVEHSSLREAWNNARKMIDKARGGT